MLLLFLDCSTLPLKRTLMLSVKQGGIKGEVVREGQGYLCWWRDMMMMMKYMSDDCQLLMKFHGTDIKISQFKYINKLVTIVGSNLKAPFSIGTT